MKKNNLHDKSTSSFEWQGRLWLKGPEGTFLGYGRVVLLERIQDHGSIAKAAKSMEMSYKHAWDLLNSMTQQAGCPLATTTKGGKGGGGAILTPAGEKAIAVFWHYHARFQNVLAEMTAKLEDVLCDKGNIEPES